MDAKFDPYRAGEVQAARDVEIPRLEKQLQEMNMSLEMTIDELQKRLEAVSSVPNSPPIAKEVDVGAISPLGTFLVDQIRMSEKLRQRIRNIMNSLQI